MKTAGVVENYGHCIYSIRLMCFRNCLSLFQLVFYLLQSNTRYFIDHLERFTYHYIYANIYIYIYVHVVVHIYVCMCIHVYVCTCMYIYVHIYICI